MKCRHCAREVERLDSGVYIDAAGMPACVKGGLWKDPLTGAVQRRDAVQHVPVTANQQVGGDGR